LISYKEDICPGCGKNINEFDDPIYFHGHCKECVNKQSIRSKLMEDVPSKHKTIISKQEQEVEKPFSLPLAQCPKELEYLKQKHRRYRLFVDGRIEGEDFIVENIKIGR
jgi:hypothetical protein